MNTSQSCGNARIAHQRIFISYRREDSGWAARRLYEVLAEEFCPDRVFMDIDNIPFADDFRQTIADQLQQASVCLVLIGPRWLDILQRRASDPRDFVRIELETAKASGVRVIPLMLDGTNVPDNEALPESLHDLNLPDINGLPLRSGIDLQPDLQRIVASLGRLLSELGGGQRDRVSRKTYTWHWFSIGLAVMALTVVALFALGYLPGTSEIRDETGRVGEVIQDGLMLRDEESSTPSAGLSNLVVWGPEMVLIPAGKFMMGAPPGNWGYRPQREVSVSKFAIGKAEVTFEEYDLFAESTGRELPKAEWGRGQQPVINVTWHDAKAYVEWLSEQTGRSYRLPSEAEWEYVARAGTTTPFSTGNCVNTDLVNYDGRGQWNRGPDDCGPPTGVFREQTLPAGSLAPNEWGVHEIQGNVSEWVDDCWHEHWDGAPTDGSAWDWEGPIDAEGNCRSRVTTGGDWSDKPFFIAIGMRGGADADHASNTIGFRAARDL